MSIGDRVRRLLSDIRKASVAASPHGRERPITVQLGSRDEWLRIDEIGFHGRWIRSANERWVLAYGQIFDPTARNWSSDDPTGTVILFDQGKQRCRLDRLCRPESVAVSDCGVFAVYEWGPSGEFLGPLCRLRVFRSDGACIFEHRAGAAIECPTLSSDGCYLAFHTLGAPRESPRPQDGESVFLVDLTGPTVLWNEPVPLAWPRRITFDEASRHVVLHGPDNKVFRFTYAGEFLDADVVARVSLQRAENDDYGYRLFDLARSHLSEIRSGKRPAEAEGEAVSMIRKALTKKMSPNTQATAHRILGEIAQERGDVSAAIEEYLAALALNPKIGLKRKLKNLEARSGSKEDPSP